SKKRSPLLPSTATFAEQGVAQLDVSVWIGIAAPAGTPPAIVERLSAEFNKALALPDVKDKLAALGVDPVGGTSEAFTRFVRGDIERWSKIIAAAGVKPE